MTVASIAARLQVPASGSVAGPVRVLGPAEEGTGAARIGDGGPAFRETMTQAINAVDGAQKTADAQVEAFVAGETENVSDVMIAMNNAELHFQLLTEVRNKLLDGYQELMRMQV